MVEVLLEATIRKQLGEAETRLLDRWTDTSLAALGRPLEVVTVDRRHVPEWANVPGVFNTVEPRTLPERGLVLLVMMDYGEAGTFDEIVWTHEVGHWVLFLGGFLMMRNFDNSSFEIEVALNSVTHHRALYALQRSCGVDPQPTIEARAAHHRDRFANVTPGTFADPLIALVAADEILSCSKSLGTEIQGIVEERHPKAGPILRGVLEACAQYDLQSADGVQRVTHRIVPLLGLGHDWVDWDNRAKLIEAVKRDSANTWRADR